MEEKTTENLYKFDPPAKRGNKGLKIWIGILLGIILLSIIFWVSGCNIIGNKKQYKPSDPYIGVLFVEGSITSKNTDSWGIPFGYQHSFTLNTINELIADQKNKGLILYVNSPGGGVYESDELYFKIKEYKQKTGRPVYSYMGSMAASGGYYISTPADKIIANRNCWTGSIGVSIGTLFDISQFLEKYGVRSITITSGRNKAMGSIVDPLTDEQLEIFQSLIDEAYGQFVGIVSEERDIELNKTIELADGRIYTAKQALELNLIDSIGTFDNAVSDMQSTYNLEHCDIYHIKYVDDSIIGLLFNKLPRSQHPKGEAEIIMSLIKNDVNFPISYMCELLN
jgi:protease-4